MEIRARFGSLFCGLIAMSGAQAGSAALVDQVDRYRSAFDATELSAGVGTPPLVYGALKSPGAKRTVVFYAHYDGQPVTRAQWSSDPFVPVMRSGPLASGEHAIDWRNVRPPYPPEWRLFARAASDDKASIIAFLADILRANQAPFASDLWLIGDGPVHQRAARCVRWQTDCRLTIRYQ